MNIFVEMLHAVYDGKSYALFLRDRKRKTFLFGVVLVTLYYLVAVITPYTQFRFATGGVMQVVDKFVPDFRLSDGKLWVERTFSVTDGTDYVYVDTGDYVIDDQEAEQILQNYDTVLLMDSERAIFRSTGKVQTVCFADFGDVDTTKNDILEHIRPYVFAGTIAILVVVFLFMQAAFFFGVLFVALFGMILASIMKEKMTFGQLYQMGVYSRTTPLLIKAVLSLLPFGIPFYWLISLVISLAYLRCGICQVRAEREEERRTAERKDGFDRGYWNE